MELSVQVAEHKTTCKTLAYKNNLLNKRVYEFSKKDSKGKGKRSRIQFHIKEEVTNVKVDLIVSFNRNFILEEEQTRVKTELVKALK